MDSSIWKTETRKGLQKDLDFRRKHWLKKVSDVFVVITDIGSKNVIVLEALLLFILIGVSMFCCLLLLLEKFIFSSKFFSV